MKVTFKVVEKFDVRFLDVFYDETLVTSYSEPYIEEIRGACRLCLKRQCDGLPPIHIHCGEIPRHLAWAWRAGAIYERPSQIIKVEWDLFLGESRTYSWDDVEVCPRCFSELFGPYGDLGYCTRCGLIVEPD